MKNDIIKACTELQEALLAEYAVSQQELEAKSQKEKCRLATQHARDAIREIRFYN